jgi:colicin import membrane protein
MVELRSWHKDPGIVVSGGAHALALIFLLLNFSHAPKFDDAIETVPVEMVTTSELNEITNGEKTAKLMPTPQRRVDQVAELEQHNPLPPTPEAKKDTPPLPSPEKANDDPGHDEKPPEPTAAVPPPPPPPPQPDVPTPPERPTQAENKPAPTPPPKPADVKPPPPPDAEAIAPEPPPRPKTPPKDEAKNEAKDEPKPVPPARPADKKVAKVVPPAPPKRPDPKPDPKKDALEDVAKLLKDMKPPKPVTKQRSGSEVKEARSHDDFSLDKISALLDHETPQRKASTGRALTQMASLGSPTAHAEKLSPSMAAQLDGWLIDHYRGCWSYFGLGATQDYVPQLRIRMAQDGSLIGQPALLNPPNDPNLKSLADSAIRAVNRCNPLEIPDRFRPFYEEGYKQRIVRFDPKEMS